MKNFAQEFHTLRYIVDHAQRFLVVAHTRPDPDAVGSVLALKYYLEAAGKDVTIACHSPFPEFLTNIFYEKFHHPDDLDCELFDVVIGADSVERGFDDVLAHVSDAQISVAIDHHIDSKLDVDLELFDESAAAACEIIYRYFVDVGVTIDKKIATALLVGILGDTGGFQHANTSAQIMTIAADLLHRGADTTQIMQKSFANKKLSTLKLWGRALMHARLDRKSGMIATALTRDDLGGDNPTAEDIKEVALILSTVPQSTFSVIIFQISERRIKASLRADKDAGVDVSAIARLFGGGGHALASGFEMNGRIVEVPGGWQVV